MEPAQEEVKSPSCCDDQWARGQQELVGCVPAALGRALLLPWTDPEDSGPSRLATEGPRTSPPPLAVPVHWSRAKPGSTGMEPPPTP